MAARWRDFSILLCLFVLNVSVICWDSDDFELFDLVEEVNKNFYEFMDIDQSATLSEVKKAYRKKSLQYHPDKNDEEGAETKFRQTVAIYEVLKDEKKRERYNQVLVEGLPDWRQPVFYYRRARKMGLYELAVVLSIILTVGQYFVAWGIYVEKRLVMEEVLSSKKKKRNKRNKNQTTEDDGAEDDELNAIPTPQILDLWPFKLSSLFFVTVYNLPETIREWNEERKRRKEEEEEARAAEILAAQEAQNLSEEYSRKPKKKVQTELPEYTSEMYSKFSASANGMRTSSLDDEKKSSTVHRTGEWTDEELVLLSRAVNRFPGGTHQRWEKIADMVGRSVPEVTSKLKETKNTSYSVTVSSSVQGSNFNTKPQVRDDIITQNLPIMGNDQAEPTGENPSKKRNRSNKPVKTAERTLLIAQNCSSKADAAKVTSSTKVETLELKNSGDVWTQNQQTIFEWALKTYPKGTDRRWDLVAEHIPGKSKEDCITRFKALAELVNKKKKTEQGDKAR